MYNVGIFVNLVIIFATCCFHSSDFIIILEACFKYETIVQYFVDFAKNKRRNATNLHLFNWNIQLFNKL